MFYKGQEIELPKYTIAIADKIEQAKQANGTRNQYQAVYSLLRETVGAEALAEIVDGSTLETADLQEMMLLYVAVTSAYNAPIIEAQATTFAEQMATINNSLGDISRIMEAVNAAKPQRQGFARVK